MPIATLDGLRKDYLIQSDSDYVIPFTVQSGGMDVDVSSGYTFAFDIFDPTDRSTNKASYALSSGIAFEDDGSDGEINITIDAPTLWAAGSDTQLNYEYVLYVTVSSVQTSLAYGKLTIQKGVHG